MSGALVWVAPETFEQTVLEACSRAVPLGAYASREGSHYLFLERTGAFALSQRFGEVPIAPSLAATFPLFAWDEREMQDEWGVRVENLPDARPYFAHDGVLPAAILASGTGVMHAVVGPVHAGIIEPGRFTFSTGGETVIHLDAQLGYAHRGVERRLAGMPVIDAAPSIARICAGCSASRSYAYALALEALAGIEIERGADLARLVVAELERIYNHLADLAASAAGAGSGPGFARGMALKERAMRLCRLATGHRLLFDAIVPGGVSATTLREPQPVYSELAALESAVESYLEKLFANVSLVARWRQAGVVGHDTVRAFGAVGPAHRASKGQLDLRAFTPYGAYRSIPTRVAAASSGDAFARCRVKRDEIRESFRLIGEALSQWEPPAPSAPGAVAIPAGFALGVTEGPRGTEAVAVHVGRDGCIERFHAISASYRNWPIVVRAMEGNIVPDFPLVNKSFNLCYACVDR